MLYKNKVGKLGEDLAKDYLKRQGFEILESNLKISYQEIDIICRKNDCLVFVEVKTRASERFGKAEDALSPLKMKLVRRAAARFMSRGCGVAFGRFRFDFIAIDLCRDSGKAKLKHFKDIV